MTWELLGEDRKKEYIKQAREAAEALGEDCEHETTLGGECLEHGGMCDHEDQEKCSKYFPSYPNHKERR